MKKRRIVIGITGASGAILGIRLLEAIRRAGIETHLILSKWAEYTITAETGYTPDEVRALADRTYCAEDLAAAVSSGSFHTDGMIIVPCSMKSLAAIAAGFSYNLITRCADVTLKERRRLVIVPRETPLSSIHLENMLKLSRMGTVVLPPCIGFYTRPEELEDVVSHLVGKMLDLLGVENDLYCRWGEAPGQDGK